MKANTLELSIQTLSTASSKCDYANERAERSVKLIKQTSKYLEQHAALSLPSVESCPLSKIPGYLPKLRGCVAGKINDNIMEWKRNRTAICRAAEEVIGQCVAVDRVYRANKRDLPVDPDPCHPRPHTLLETVHDCRHAFGQLLHVLLVEEEDLSGVVNEEVSNILQDLQEVQAILKACRYRLQICEPALVPRADDCDDALLR